MDDLQLLTEQQAAKMLRLEPHTLTVWRCRKPHKATPGHIPQSLSQVKHCESRHAYFQMLYRVETEFNPRLTTQAPRNPEPPSNQKSSVWTDATPVIRGEPPPDPPSEHLTHLATDELRDRWRNYCEEFQAWQRRLKQQVDDDWYAANPVEFVAVIARQYAVAMNKALQAGHCDIGRKLFAPKCRALT